MHRKNNCEDVEQLQTAGATCGVILDANCGSSWEKRHMDNTKLATSTAV